MSEPPAQTPSPIPTSPSKEDEAKKVATTSNSLNAKKLEGDGLVFKGKLIGMEDLSIDRDEKICLDSMFKLKAVVRARGEHKQKIQLNLTMTSVKIIDDTTKAQVASHEIERISFVVIDPRDTRAFGYIFNTADDRHQFWAIKTERAAAATVLALKELFELAFEQFTSAEKAKFEATKSTTSSPVDELVSTQEPPQSILDSPLPPASTPVVPTASSSILDDDLWGDSSTPTTIQTPSLADGDLMNIKAPPIPVKQPAPKIIDPLEELFNELSATQPPAPTYTTPLLDSSYNAAPAPTPPLINPFGNSFPQRVDYNVLNTTPILPQQLQQQPLISTRLPPPQQPRQNLLATNPFSPVASTTVTNPFGEFDILGGLQSGTTTRTTKEAFFPVMPPPKTIQELQMAKQT